MLKAHKITPQELSEKKIPPSRFVTDLSNGVTSRSDKFIVWKWLAPLARDYCTDLVKDSTEALCKLDALEKAGIILDNGFLSFSLDVVSLYDSLRHDVVMEALDHAIETCRPDWDPDLKSWLKELIDLSFKSAVVKFQNCWYVSENGIPTGGIPSVDLGNITVFYVMRHLVYNPEVRPVEMCSFMRFVDDGTGIWQGAITHFHEWIDVLKQSSVALYGLDFTYEVHPITEPCQFLDIQFSFNNGTLATDVYRKPTDANRYLEFSSYHPRHTFRSIIYSQGLRYRRIINSDVTLSMRLEELKGFFLRSSYPPNIVNEVLNDIKNKPRTLDYTSRSHPDSLMTPWIVTFGSGTVEARAEAETINRSLRLSETWRHRDDNNTPLLKVVTRRAPSIKDLLFRRKAIALSEDSSSNQLPETVPCTDPKMRKKGAKCQCCSMVSRGSYVTNAGMKINICGGNCKSKNIIYAVTCKHCSDNNVYIGKTVLELRNRINGHRAKFYDILRNSGTNDFVLNPSEIPDEQILGAHLYLKHNLVNKENFNESYVVDVVSHCSPKDLRVREQFYIHALKTLTPLGLNQMNSVSGV